jgi:hypothetical protein
MTKYASLVLALLATSLCHAQGALPPLAGPVTVHPTSIELRHPRQPHSIQVFATTQDGFSLDLRGRAKFSVADAKIVAIDADGWVRPLASGQTKVMVAVAGQTFEVAVKVALPAQEPQHSFRHEVMPVLSRAGCNMGACHGYSLGKNGFKLSLRGADPDQDFPAIRNELAGRRINVLAPEASMLVAKPRGDALHEGGVRFARGSLSDQILINWIKEGCPGDLKDQSQVVAVKLVPDKLVLSPTENHQLQLLAVYSDGTTRDVTRLGIFSANNTQFADTTDEGLVTAGDVGETAIVARFERTFAATSVMVLDAKKKFTPTPVPTDHLVDRHVIEKLNRLKVTPSPVAGDEEFLRRVFLDLIGVQPKPDEIRAFLADKDPAKREKVIDSLFKRPEFVDHWSLKWGDLLQNSRTAAGPQSVYLFREFMRSAVASNMPLDEFARRILTARGGMVDDPASVYFAISKDTNETVERVTQVFCGVRMLCARCHAHPMENWTQADYFGLASFFNQVTVKPDTRFAQQGQAGKSVVVQLNLAAGAATNPRTSRPQPPRFLGGEEPKLDGGDRREAYAQWLTSPKNPFFARGLVNRFWSYFFHRGIIEPVDDIRSTNPPINPALLDALTEDFVKGGFDVRRLMRLIVTSETYQRTSIPNESNAHDEQNFSHAIPRRIPAEALLDSLVQATGVPEAFPGVPGGFRAAQLPDGVAASPFLNLFGKPQRQDACECERDNGSNMLQALHFINGKSILGRVQNAQGRPALLLRQKLAGKELVNELYLWSIARHPTDAEMKLALDYLEANKAKLNEGVEDLMWVLLNSRDFLMVH